MRELHVVAVSEDGRHVVLATRKGALKGEFRVPLDERLSAAVRGDLPRPGESQPTVVTPKEIQARLRAGESTEEIAASAGVPVSKIERYAGPVLSERERVLNQARAGFVTRSRLGESALPLGEAVDRHLSETTGVRLETVAWSSRREDTGSWLVELSYVSQARRRSATWRYDVSRREVTAVDSLAAALAHVDGSGRRSRASEADALPAPAARRAAPARKAVRAGKAPAARKPAARPAAPPVRAAAPVPRAAAPARAAQTAATRAAAASAARATTARAAAQERAAKAAAAEAARAAEQAQEAADAQARAAEARAAKAAKAAAAKAAKDAAARKKAAKERAAHERAEKAAAARAAKKAAEKAAAEKAAAEAAPTGPPTLRVVGAEDAPIPARRGPKEPPAAARTAPARVAGQRASVPVWADVLLSTAPVVRPDAEPDAD